MVNRAFLGISVVALMAAAAAADQWQTTATSGTGVLVHEDTRLRQLDPVFQTLFLPDGDEDLKLTSTIQLFPLDPGLFTNKRVKGNARAKIECLTENGNQIDVGSVSGKFARNGALAVTEQIPADLDCQLFALTWQFFKKFQLPAGTSVQFNSAVEMVGDDADTGCFDRTSLCLNDDRFMVEVDWRDFQGGRGPGIAFPRTDDSGTFFFFDADNTELLLKVLDGCARNDHFWVFYGATTNVEFDVTVTDTLTNQSRVYGNPLGRPAPAIVDTQAFATCP